MKPTTAAISTLALLFVNIILATASSAADVVDTSITFNSGILVLAFAGFLALVVVVQAVPAIITLYGMIKGAVSAKKNEKKSMEND